MKHSEAILAIRHLAAYFPNQKFDEFTADAWAEALIKYEYDDAMEVIRKVATTPLRPGQSFLLELRDITGELDAVLRRRVEDRRDKLPPIPSGLEGSEYAAWMAQQYAAIKKRDWTPPPAIESGAHRATGELVGRIAGEWAAP